MSLLDAVSIADIQRAVVAHYGLRIEDMTSDRRGSSVARPRQVAMWLAARLSRSSFPVIGHSFHRDHTTVMYAAKKVPELMNEDAEFAAESETIMGGLRALAMAEKDAAA